MEDLSQCQDDLLSARFQDKGSIRELNPNGHGGLEIFVDVEVKVPRGNEDVFAEHKPWGFAQCSLFVGKIRQGYQEKFVSKEFDLFHWPSSWS